MTDMERAIQVRDKILKTAPAVYSQKTEVDKWATAILCTEYYYSVTVEEKPKKKEHRKLTLRQQEALEHSICNAWREGKTSGFISMMYDVSRAEVYFILRKHDFHALYCEDLNYSIHVVNAIISNNGDSQLLTDMVRATYKDWRDRASFGTVIAGTPSKEEAAAIIELAMRGEDVSSLARESGRTKKEIGVMVNMMSNH